MLKKELKLVLNIVIFTLIVMNGIGAAFADEKSVTFAVSCYVPYFVDISSEETKITQDKTLNQNTQAELNKQNQDNKIQLEQQVTNLIQQETIYTTDSQNAKLIITVCSR